MAPYMCARIDNTLSLNDISRSFIRKIKRPSLFLREPVRSDPINYWVSSGVSSVVEEGGWPSLKI